MVKGDSFDDHIVSETGNWNVADKFSKIKIMLPLAKCDFYEDLAQFGYESFVDELMDWNNIPTDVARVKGITRLVKELLRLCQNAKFAMNKYGTKATLQGYEDQLEAINSVIPATYSIKYSAVRKTRDLVIDPEKFTKVLERVIKIKSLINEPLNKNDLIFTSTEEFDPKAFKQAIIERMKNKG